MIRFITLLAALLLMSPQAGAQPEQDSIPICTVYSLSRTCVDQKIGTRAYVRDADSATDCTTGNGTTLNACRFNGFWWVDDESLSGSGVTLATDGEVDAAKAVNAADPRINAAAELAGNASPGPETQSITMQVADANGNSPNPLSTLVLDSKMFFGASRGAVRDDDGSIWTSGTANAVTDWIKSSTTVSVTPTATLTTLTPAGANDWDLLFCRDSAASYVPCSNTGAGCTNTGSTAYPEAGVFCATDTGLCEPVGSTTFNGCNSGASATVGLTNRLSTTSAGTFQKALPDGVHGSASYYTMVAQTILNASMELVYVPAKNLVSGDADGGACTGWTVFGAGAVSIDSAATAPGTVGDPITNTACQYTSRTAAADKLATPSITALAGGYYAARGYIRLNDAGTNILTVQAVDATTGTAHTNQRAFIQRGPVLTELTSGALAAGRTCYEYCLFIVVWQTDAGSAASRIAAYTDAGTDRIDMDNWIAFPKEAQTLALTPLFSRDSVASVRVESDSRGDGVTRLIQMLETAFSAGFTRPDLFPAFDISDRSYSLSGRSLDDVVNSETFSTIDAATPTKLTVVQLGVNDWSDGDTASVFVDLYQTVAQRIRQTGSRPLIITEPPWRSNTSITSCRSGTINCGAHFEDISDELIFADPAARLHGNP